MPVNFFFTFKSNAFKSITFSLILGGFLVFFFSCSPQGSILTDTTNTDVTTSDSKEEDINIGDNAKKDLPNAFIENIPKGMEKWYDDDPDNGEIRIDVRDSMSVANWSDFSPKAVSTDSMPNILFVLYDDTGLGAWSPYGGKIQMPTLDALAEDGLTFTQWHTTALCSPTRSTIMTGRNHHLNGMGSITETADGFPGANGRVPPECMPFAEVLQNNGYSTFWLGKNHNVPETDVAPGAYRGEWPLQQGFDRYYGFLGGETNNWYPDLVEDNRFVEAPSTPADSPDPEKFPELGYHLSNDLATKALEMLRNQQASNPHKPWYMWYCPGANHAPHHSPPSYTQKYIDEKTFEGGYDLYRKDIHEAMMEKGVIPKGTAIPDYNFLDETVRNDLDTITPWDELDAKQQELFVRMAEVYAGFSTYTDVQIGRIIDYLKETNQYDNTIIMYAADNGASGEGSPAGSVNENKFFNGYPDEPVENQKFIETLGTADTYNHYPTGWAMAFSAPFKMFKRYSQFAGGTNDPLVISWPKYMRKNGIKGGTLRHQYHHSVDIVPTLLEATGLEMPDTNAGVIQEPLSGISMLYSFAEPNGATKKEVQYYSMLGTRGIWKNGWKAMELHAPTSGNGNFSDEGWELYRIDPLFDQQGNMVLEADRSENNNLAQNSAYSDTLDMLIAAWYEQAAINKVLPLDDRLPPELTAIVRPNPEPVRNVYRYYPKTAAVPEGVAVNVRGRPYTIRATVTTDDTVNLEGVLFAHGSRFGGHTMYIKGDTLKYLYNFLGIEDKQYETNLLIKSLQPNTEYIFTARFDTTATTSTAYVGDLTLTAGVLGDPDSLGKETSEDINTQPAKFTLSGDGLCVGYDSADAVTTNYPNFDNQGAFTGGTIKHVIVRVEGEPVRNHKLESRAMMMRH